MPRIPSRGRRAPSLVLLGLLAACGSGSSPTPSAAPSGEPSATTSAGTTNTSTQPAAWLTYGHDAARSGVDPSSPPVSSPRRAWTSPRLDGAVYAQPLIDGDTVLVATEGGSLYGLDAGSGAVRWRRHVADPVSRSALPCGNIFPLGITGTPVIDPTTHVAYAVAETGGGEHRLAAVDVKDGSLRWTRAVDTGGTQRIAQQQRAALALTRGRVVVAMGGLNGDCGDYKGYVVAVDADGGGPLRSWVVPTTREGGIWASAGPVIGESSPDVFVVTGNGEQTRRFDHGNAVVRLTPDMQEVGYFASPDWSDLNAGDIDLGSTGAAVVPGGRLIVAGKDGVAYLLHQDRLGGIGGQAARVTVGGSVFGGIAVDGDVAYVPSRSALVAVRVGSGDSLSIVWRSQAVWTAMVAGGRVWGLSEDGTLLGIDPRNGAVRARLRAGSVEHFAVPSAADGRLYVGTSSGVVAFSGV